MKKGVELERWLTSPEHRQPHDFLDMPYAVAGNDLRKGDIVALRVLAASRGGAVPKQLLAGMARLYLHGIIGRFTTEENAVYFMTSLSYEVLKHNASFRGGP